MFADPEQESGSGSGGADDAVLPKRTFPKGRQHDENAE